jgi:hypothetical protein
MNVYYPIIRSNVLKKEVDSAHSMVDLPFIDDKF